MTIKEKPQRNNGRPPVTLDDAINRARGGLTEDFPTLRTRDARFIACSTELVIKRGFTKGGSSVFLKDEIIPARIRGVNRRGRKVVWYWERTPDGKSRLAHCVDRIKDIKASVAA
jgi:hypothetical protein